MKAEHLRNHVYQMVMSSLFLALCYVLPNFTGNIPVIGSALLPMHLPVLICGFICGPMWGAAVGFIAPVSRSLLMTMPTMSVAIPMGFEMAVYGFVCGILFRIQRKKNVAEVKNIYISLVSAMVLGRIVYGFIKASMTFGTANPYTFSAFIAGTVTSAIPGIVLQLVFVPVVVKAVIKYKNPETQQI